MRNPRDFFKPLAIDAPEPIREIPFKPSRMIHFMDFSNQKMVEKTADLAPKVDILLGNLEDAISVDKKEAARAGLIKVGREIDLGDTALWTRVNELASPWVLDDLTEIVTEIGDKLEVVMIPKVEGPWDIHYVDRLLAQLEARAGLERPILIHACSRRPRASPTSRRSPAASPRIQGMSFGPADLAASRRMKTTRVGGGHPGYRTIADPDPERSGRAPRQLPAGPVALLDRPHGRRLHVGRRAPLLRPLRRHLRRARLRNAVPCLVPARLRGRLVAAPRRRSRSPSASSRRTPRRWPSRKR